MKKFLFVFLILLVAQASMAQRYYVDLGLGAGSALGQDDPQGKLMLRVAAMRQFSDSFHLGLELSKGGSFVPSDNSRFEGATEIIDPIRAQWSSAMLRAKVFPMPSFPVYVGAGVGINSYWFNVNTVEADRTSQINLALAPEVGVTINQKFNLGLKYLAGGSTGSFEGNKPAEFGGNVVRLESESVNILLFTMGIRIGL